MEDDGQTYLLPFPAVARVIMTVAGAFALFIAPYELWRGVWPLNLTTPFFGFIMFGGMYVGANFVYAGLVPPSGRLIFRDGALEVEKRYLFGIRRSVISADRIHTVDVVEDPNSEGPSDWRAAICVSGVDPIYSRPLGTPDAAQALASVFRAKLGIRQPSASA